MKSVELAAGLYGEDFENCRIERKMDLVFKESKAKQDQAKQQEAVAQTELTRAQIDVMDSAIIRRLLKERGLRRCVGYWMHSTYVNIGFNFQFGH